MVLKLIQKDKQVGITKKMLKRGLERMTYVSDIKG